MQKFEKIKTVADKRIAAAKRGKLVANDFVKGDILFITEKVDGHNASFSNDIAYSREHIIQEDTNAPLVPFTKIVHALNSKLDTVIADVLDPTHEYQFYGEFMVRNRVVPYLEDVYEKWVMFDIFDKSTGSFLGTKKAIEVADRFRNSVDTITGDKILTPEVLHDEYEFTTYEDLEQFIHQFHQSSSIGVNGIMEGGVVSNLSRSFQNKPLRAKIVNKQFKETQRAVTNEKNHSVAMRQLMQYLTQNRVSKIVMNLCDTGVLQPLSSQYYTTQLELAVRTIAKDITEETPYQIDYQTIQAGEDVYNKIEAMARLTMIDRRNSL